MKTGELLSLTVCLEKIKRKEFGKYRRFRLKLVSHRFPSCVLKISDWFEKWIIVNNLFGKRKEFWKVSKVRFRLKLIFEKKKNKGKKFETNLKNIELLLIFVRYFVHI